MATALLVIDMQKVFLPMTTTALPNILKLIAHFRTRNLPVMFTQHGHSDAELTPPFQNQLVRKWGPDGSIRTGSEGWEFINEIGKEVREAEVLPKNTYDAFVNTPLDPRLRSMHITRLVICGVMTDCCCDTTARSAFNRGFDTQLVRDACGSANSAQHEAGLKGFEFACGGVVGTEEVVGEGAG